MEIAFRTKRADNELIASKPMGQDDETYFSYFSSHGLLYFSFVKYLCRMQAESVLNPKARLFNPSMLWILKLPYNG